MKNLTIKAFFIPALALITFLTSCDYREIGEVNYGDQKIYIPAAAAADGSGGFNGLYNISTLAVTNRDFRYVVDKTNRKLNIPLSVFRSGAILSGDVNVDITSKADTVNKIITNGVLKGTSALVLPSTAFTLESNVNIPSGASTSAFTLSVDLNYLLSKLTNQHVIGISISSTQVALTAKYATAIIYIDPQFLVPSAGFTFLTNTGTKKIDFKNSSVNGLTYSWNYGDGSAIETTISPSHTYTTSGSYSVTLTAFGALGDENKSALTKTVVVP